MATAIPTPPPDNMGLLSSNAYTHLNGYSRNLSITELDLKDHRYPTLNPPSVIANQRASTMTKSQNNLVDDNTDDARGNGSSGSAVNGRADSWAAQQVRTESPRLYDAWADVQQQQQTAQKETAYVSPTGAPRRIVDRYSMEDLSGSGDVRQNGGDSSKQDTSTSPQHPPKTPRSGGQSPSWTDSPAALLPSSPRHPSLPAAGVGAGPSNSSTIVPMSAAPNYNPSAISIPVSPKPRAYAQHPTYITPPSAPHPVNPILSQNPPVPPEEVCIECAMRDQDMADVDVTGPGVWDRESDVYYHDLVQKEEQEEASGSVSHDSSRPRAKGERALTEHYLKIWTGMNPKEPSARQQTVSQYVKSQRMLLEAETLARAQAMQESRQLDNKMRDTYSQLRRSAYELGSSVMPDDDSGGIRIKTPRSTSMPSGGLLPTTHAREVTLLENGMIVEHVDVRKEEKEERERRRKDERRDRSRARKSSKGSAVDVNSIYSVQSRLPPHTDSGFHSGLKPGPRYSQSITGRPLSVLTTERPPTLPRAYSQASFSDVQSVGSSSPNRRSRFFGLGSLSPGWRSQNSLAQSGMSGSMVDMHVALQRERQAYPSVDIGSNAPSLRLSQMWPGDTEPERGDFERAKSDTAKSKKKKKGLAKIWRIVTGAASKSENHIATIGHGHQALEDDLPLAPPPPLSYLVDRISGDQSSPSPRHSMPSLSSSVSPNHALSSAGMSPPTAPSSLLPSPSSSRKSDPDRETGPDLQRSCGPDDTDPRLTFTMAEETNKSHNSRSMHAVLSDSEVRGRSGQESTSSSFSAGLSPTSNRPASMMKREKSLPPLPDEAEVRFPTDTRPQTVFTYDPPSVSMGLVAPQAPFRTGEARRQSFGGIGSRPQLPIQSPPKGALATGHLSMLREPFTNRYNEFGISRRSLGRLDDLNYGQSPSPRPRPRSQTPSKRKSRFGLSSLFGKKSPTSEHRDPVGSAVGSVVGSVHEYSGWRSSDSEGRHDAGSGHSTLPRMSVISRRNIEELVEQDPDFVAYRYPSNDQRLDLLR